VKVLVTGANGFLGSNLTRRLIDDGMEVTALVRPTSDRSFLDGVPARLVMGDLSNATALRTGMAGAEVVYHVAGLASDWAPWREFFHANVTGVANVMTAAREAGVRRVLHVSSAAIHGFAGYRDRRESDPTPVTPYPYVETKRRGEEIALATEGVEVVVVRPGNVYGPRDRITMLPMIRAMESGLMGVIDGGRFLTCPAYVGNLVSGIQRAVAEPKAAGRVYLLTDGLDVTWRDWVDALADALGLRRPRLSVPKRLATRLAMGCEAVFRGLAIRAAPPLTLYRVANGGNDYHFSIDRARRELGHEPRIGLREACERTAAWFREKGSVG